jgi:hypothetical protein
MHAHAVRLLVASAAMAVAATGLPAQGINNNYPDRKAIVVNNSPHVELSGFTFQNAYQDRTSRFNQDMRWKNIGEQAIVAFEVVVLKYDPFHRRLVGSRWTVSGRNSADWTPLAPGESNGDGLRGIGSEIVHSAVAYIRHVRLADGTIWTANESELLAALRRAAPHIREFGDVKPDSGEKQ